MSGFLVINPRSGDADPSAEELRDEARRRGIETPLRFEIEPTALRVLLPPG